MISGNVAALHTGVAAFGEVLLEDDLITGNTGGTSPFAVGIQGTQSAVLNRNTIVANGGTAVFLGDQCTFTMTNNIIAADQGVGVSLVGTEDPYGNPLEIYGWLYHNTLADNDSVGIQAYAT